MQSLYTVLQSPRVSSEIAGLDNIVFISNKFSWGAFLVPLIWLPMHRMWFAFMLFLGMSVIFLMNIYLFIFEEYHTEALFLALFLIVFLSFLGNSISNKTANIVFYIILIAFMLLVFAYMSYFWFDANFLGNLAFEGFAIDISIWFIGGILALNCFAQLANDHRIGFLERKGWRIVGSIIASSRGEAEFRYINEQLLRAKGRESSIGERVNQTAQRTNAKYDINYSSENMVIGLFPKPENMS